MFPIISASSTRGTEARKKMLITELYKYSVCCSYDEVCLFRYSAGVHEAQKYDEVGFGLSSGASLRHCIQGRIRGWGVCYLPAYSKMR